MQEGGGKMGVEVDDTFAPQSRMTLLTIVLCFQFFFLFLQNTNKTYHRI